MIIEINESKTSTKHLSCEFKCKFDGTKCNSNRLWNNNKCLQECKKSHVCEKDYFWNPARCNCENIQRVLQMIQRSSVMKLQSHTRKRSFYILRAFSLISIALLIAVNIYCYLIKYQAQSLLPFHEKNNELNKFCIDIIN